MNTAAWVGQHRRPNWPLIGFVVAHVTLITATLLLIPAFGSRLPAEARQDAAPWITWEIVGIGTCLLLSARRHEQRASFALETALPISLALVGIGFSMVLAIVLINLDAQTYQRLLESVPGVGLIFCSMLMWFMFGRYLGAEAAANRLRRETASSQRSAWLAEVRVDRSWRLLFGIFMGVPTALLILWMVVPHPAVLPAAFWLAANWALAMIAGQRAFVSITDGGIKVRGSTLLGAGGWSLRLAEIASARVVTAEPRQNFSTSRRGGRCILRSGPALEVTSATGGRYVVSLPEAEDAVTVLAGLRGRNLKAVPASSAILSARS